MLVTTEPLLDGLSVVKIHSRRLRPDILRYLDSACDRASQEYRYGILFDFSSVKRASVSGVAAIVELMARRPKIDFAFCGVSADLKATIEKCGLDRHLRIFADTKTAAKSSVFCQYALTSTRAIVRVQDAHAEIQHLTGERTIASLDILGRPLLVHFVSNLKYFGIRDLILETPKGVAAGLQRHLIDAGLNQGVFFVERPLQDRVPHSAIIAPATRLNLTEDDCVLFAALDGLFKPDLGALRHEYDPVEKGIIGLGPKFLTPHQQVTQLPQTSNTVRPPIIFARAHDLFESVDQISKGSGHLPPVETLKFVTPTTVVKPITAAAHYLNALRLASKNVTTLLPPVGEEIEDRIWRAPGAVISPRARITGFCFAGPFSRIESATRLSEFNCIGAHTKIERRCALDNTIILPRVTVASGSRLNHQIFNQNSSEPRPATLEMKPKSVMPKTEKRPHSILKQGAA